MYIERKIDLSVNYFIRDLFSDTPFVTIVDGFPTENLVIPTISTDLKNLTPSGGELGNKKGIKYFLFIIDVFAKNKSQRDEFSYRIMNGIEDASIPVYDYDEGFPPNVAPTQLGCLDQDELSVDIIRVIPGLVDTLYYRASITMLAHYNRL